jgi:predicted small lipoprotein YifL
MRPAHLIKTTLLIAALAATVTACGRRPGTLDTPYEAAVEARKQAQRNDLPVPPEPAQPVKDKRFFLDGLI